MIYHKVFGTEMFGKLTANVLLTLESKFVFCVDLGMFTDHKHRCAVQTHRFQNKYEDLLYQKV